MSEPAVKYKKLPGRGFRTDGTWIALSRTFCRLWLGPDHLLLVDRQGYTETYKRFYFRDIQAVVIRKTNRAAMWNGILGVFTILFGGWSLAVDNVPGRVVLWIIAGIFAFFLLTNFFGGPTCQTQIKTAVQTEQLPPWNRLRTARKGLDRIRPLLLQAQGEMSAADLRARLEERLRGPSTSSTAEPT